MANYYALFSTILPITQQQAEWLMQRLNEYEDNDNDDVGYVCESKWLDNEGLWLYSEETFDAETLAKHIQGMLKEFCMSGIIAIEWAEYCSKPLIGEFGGGWMVLTKDRYLSGCTTSDIAHASSRLIGSEHV